MVIKLKPVKLGFIRSINSNRQLKILSRTHRREIKQKFTTKAARDKEIRRFKNKQELIKGNLDVFRGLTKRKTKFTKAETNNIFRTIGNKKMILEITFFNGSKIYRTMTPSNKDDFKDFLNSYGRETQGNTNGSDELQNISIDEIKQLRFREAVEGFENKDGNYFPYINISEIDLSKYQIHREDDNFDDENCLIYTLRQYNIDEALINNVKLAVVSGVHIPRTKLINVCNIIKKSIILYHYQDKDNKIRAVKYGKFEDHIDIAIYKNHFFKYEPTIYTNFSIKNLEDCKEYGDFQNIYKFQRGKPNYNENVKKITSLQLVNLLFKDGYFIDDHLLLSFQANQPDQIDITKINLGNMENEQQLNEYKEVDEDRKITDYFYGDTETIVTEGNHKLLIGGIVKDTGDTVAIFDNNIIHKMLNYAVYKSKGDLPCIYFHNLKYDFFVMKDYLNIKSVCRKDGQIYYIEVFHFKKVNGVSKRMVVKLKDSYKLINEPLRNFAGVFNLPEDMHKKEAIGYTYYDSITSKDERAKIKDYIKHVKKEERETLKQNLIENKELFEVDFETNTFNHMAYYKYYLKYDCLVLREGLKVFGEKIKELAGLNIHEHNTISGLAFKYFQKNNAFDGVYESSGNFRDFLSRSVKGGRVSTLKNSTKKLIKKELVDYDACSLYPSAIHRICKTLGGFPKGVAKNINTKNKKDLDEKDYYVVSVRITKINKNQQIPFLSMKDKDGLLQYINIIPEGGFVDVVDKITLEDYIEHHDIEYEIIDGIYYDEGKTNVFGDLIEKLYEGRKLEKKKAENGKTEDERASGEVMQNLIKLMLNSAYGKTILKKSKTSEVIKARGTATDKYISSNFNTIIEYEHINEKQTTIKMNKIDESFNLSIVGLMVLSMSKRIMNEVMGLANDLKIKVYYQDTDSMHIKRDEIKKLEDAFKQKYGRDLNGKNLGNFHSDFSLRGADKGVEIYSTESIFLGKKCYIDKLECINKDGSKVEGVHVRLKGVTKAGIDDQIKKHGDAMTLFKKLASGKSVNFILNPVGKCSFEYNSNGVITREQNSFMREVSF